MKRKDINWMSQNMMVYPGTGKHKELRKELARNKTHGKREEAERFHKLHHKNWK
jgi:hypothetical protein